LQKKEGNKNRVKNQNNGDPGLISDQLNYNNQADCYENKLVSTYLSQGTFIGFKTKTCCFFNCFNCQWANSRQKVQYLDREKVLENLKNLSKGRTSLEVIFSDIIFNDLKGKWRELLEDICRLNIPLAWTGFFSPRDLDMEDLKLIKRSGGLSLRFRVDGSSEKTLLGLNKPFDLETVLKVSDLVHKAFLPAEYSFVFGGPGETMDTVREGIKTVKSIKGSRILASQGVAVYPGMEKILSGQSLKNKKINSSPDYCPPFLFLSPSLESYELELFLQKSFKDFKHILYLPQGAEKQKKINQKIEKKNQKKMQNLLWDRGVNSIKPDRDIINSEGPQND
jgi:hypothetical protein